MKRASARHILVESADFCQSLKEQINQGASFEDLAKEHSACPSRVNGGALGSFSEGQMVKEFDDVVFNANLNEVHGPIETQFGFHLVEVTHRSD